MLIDGIHAVVDYKLKQFLENTYVGTNGFEGVALERMRTFGDGGLQPMPVVLI